MTIDEQKEQPTSDSGNSIKLVLAAVKCRFRRYGDEEKICGRCGYVIPYTNDDKTALEKTIKSTHEKPKCGI